MKPIVGCPPFLLSLFFYSSFNAMYEGWNKVNQYSQPVYIKTLDEKCIQVPKGIVTQVNCLHKKLIEQQQNSMQNPLDLTKKFVMKKNDGTIAVQLTITKPTLENLVEGYKRQNDFEFFFGQLCKNDQDNFINCAYALGASKITRLIIETKFSPEIRENILGGRRLDARIDVVGNYLLQQKIVKQQILQGHRNRVSYIVYSPDGTRIVSGSNDKTLILWDAKTGNHIAILKGHQDWIRCVTWSPDGRYIISGADDKALIMWDGKTGNKNMVFKEHMDLVLCVAYSPDGKYIVSGSSDNSLILRNGETGDQIAILKGHRDSIYFVAYNLDGKYIISGSFDQVLILWDGKTGKKIKIFQGHHGWVSCVAWSPDGKCVVSGSDDKTLIVWDVEERKQCAIFEGHKNLITCIANSPDGEYIISGSYDNTLIMWDRKAKKQFAVLKGHQSAVHSVIHTPDGRYIISCSYDNTLIMWNGKTGELITVLKGHDDPVYCVACSPDGKHIVSGSRDKTLILWNISFLQKLAKLSPVQQEFVYRAYEGCVKQLLVTLEKEDCDYVVYKNLPSNVQGYVENCFGFTIANQ